MNRVRQKTNWIDQSWEYVTHPALLGALLLTAGVLLMSAPWIKIPARRVPGWWTTSVQATDVLQVTVLLGAAAVVFGAGVCVQSMMGRTLTSMKRSVSVLLMGAGALGSVGCWLSLQSEVPATQAPFGIGQQVEYIVGKVRGKPVRIMLPRRVRVDKLNATEPATLHFTLNRPKQTDAPSTMLTVGESIDVDGKRFTFIGSGHDVNQLQAVVSGISAQSIAAAARKGSKVRVTLNGPEYDVKDISLNYMGMGPAVQLDSEEFGPFWVFERGADGSSPVFDHGLRLMRVESMPAAVMTVGPVRAFEPLVACGLIFVLGLGGVLLWGGDAPTSTRHEEEEE